MRGSVNQGDTSNLDVMGWIVSSQSYSCVIVEDFAFHLHSLLLSFIMCILNTLEIRLVGHSPCHNLNTVNMLFLHDYASGKVSFFVHFKTCSTYC